MKVTKHSEITKKNLTHGWKGLELNGDWNGELCFCFKPYLSRLIYLSLDFKIIEKSDKTYPKLLENQCHSLKKSLNQKRFFKKLTYTFIK